MFNNLKIDLESKYKIYFGISGVIIIVGLAVMMFAGFNYGIDFRGGTNMQVAFDQTVDLNEVKTKLEPFEINPDIVYVGDAKKEILIKTTSDLPTDLRQSIYKMLIDDFKASGPEAFTTNQISPQIGSETMAKALKAVMIAAVGMLVYITFRFEWKFGIAAVIALIHDVLILVSIYAIFRIPLNSPFIVAVLTVVGYSINDTIVVFDRVRDTMKYSKTSNYFSICEKSINQTLTRSINTSLTTLLVVGALYVFGVNSIKELALPLMGGILAGTYSSIFIASPVWVLLKQKMDKKA